MNNTAMEICALAQKLTTKVDWSKRIFPECVFRGQSYKLDVCVQNEPGITQVIGDLFGQDMSLKFSFGIDCQTENVFLSECGDGKKNITAAEILDLLKSAK